MPGSGEAADERDGTAAETPAVAAARREAGGASGSGGQKEHPLRFAPGPRPDMSRDEDEPSRRGASDPGAGRFTEKPRRYAVGLMSGTSVDGIDAAAVEILGMPGDERIEVRLLAFENKPYPADVRREIFELFDPARATVDRVGAMNVRLGRLYADAALSVIGAAGLSPADVLVVGSHGQTIYHAPEAGYTVQIGEGAVIAARTGIPCVSDFRPADLAVGGQGAPLVPFTEYLLYRERDRTLLLQNIGGIGNVTVIPAGCGPEDVFAFDTGPGNMLIDGVASLVTGGALAMDAGGALAARGSASETLLGELRQDAYYALPVPKSTGRERFGADYVERIVRHGRELGLSDADLAATVTKLTAWSIGDAYDRFIAGRHAADLMIVGGGGSYNPVLMRDLAAEMAARGVAVATQEEVGGSSDAKEAIAFALLADYAMARQPANLPAATGAARPAVLGKISY
ncbi:anhydro-N-acetylmuramic acid kinase [Cohnella hashimotonis]|uniref:Anhydro-N-acetylmuramic acid kinase n=1 Tax=Cohnella hashimotonis TaxID=2826895 RepID=A0ABT6TP77_9BACL|nr:anhydro-N-acetylmuramic acid kinase [Cohnella hashimotonis]MDI4648664.1 anhydro-N-acetylmuramic acid kinase [Cohnella hashimotonis]